MIFTMPALARALADYLSPQLPGAAFYADPNQQGTRLPALFLLQTNARISSHVGGRLLRRLGLDLIYLERPNEPDADSRLQAAADVLDLCLDTFPYVQPDVRLRTYDRRWEIAEETLHYKFNLKLWLTRQEDAVLMESIQKLHISKGGNSNGRRKLDGTK